MIKNFQLLYDKYEVIKPLGAGSYGSVFLVRHISLNQLRAVKVIPRNIDNSSNDFNEAQILTELNHPGIPRIYDIEKDESNIYIVEEYIDGESLDEFLLHRQFISFDCFINLCLELCDIFSYLHSEILKPILYKDLKPEHIIVCQNHLKLIDFGTSVYVSISGNNFNRLGNVDFTAPEVFSQDDVSLTADLYSIGKLMEYAYNFLSTPDQRILRIIQKATNVDPGLRFETVEELASILKNLSNEVGFTHLYKKISIIGSFSGCGCTHASISIVSLLRFLKFDAYYFEKNTSEDLHSLYEFEDDMTEKNGYYYYKHFVGIPYYKPGINILSPSSGYFIYDFGYIPVDELALKQTFIDSELIILICSGAPWTWKNAKYRYEHLKSFGIPVKVICNLCSHSQAHKLASYLGTSVGLFSFDLDPFNINKSNLRLVNSLLSQKGGSFTFLNFIRKKLNLRKP